MMAHAADRAPYGGLLIAAGLVEIAILIALL